MKTITLPPDYTYDQLTDLLNTAFADHKHESNETVRIRLDAFGEHLTEISMILTHEQLQIIANALPVIAVIEEAIGIAGADSYTTSMMNSAIAARGLMMHMLKARTVENRDTIDADLRRVNPQHVARQKGRHNA